MRRQMVALAVAGTLAFTGHNAWGQGAYTVTDLGTVPGYAYFAASGISPNGQVTVDATTSNKRDDG